MSRLTVALMLVVLGAPLSGCGEPEPEVTPVVLNGPRPPVEEAPSPYVTSPHANLRDRSAAERGREQDAIEREAQQGESAGGGGGGGGAAVEPGPADHPTDRELEAYRRELERQTARIDATDDPCDQLRGFLAASIQANRRPGEPSPSLPSRSEMRAPCRDLPNALEQCFDRTYYGSHRAECDQQMERFARRGYRARRTAERQGAAARANDGVLPPIDDAEEEDEGSGLPIVPDALIEPEDDE